MAISSHRSEVGRIYYIGRASSEQLRACSDILSDALSGRPHHSRPSSSTALSSRASNLYIPVNSADVHS